MLIKPSQIKDFETDGAVLIKGRFFDDYCNWMRIPEFEDEATLREDWFPIIN
jgi:hypothetical protein